jgi:hypothetical protein
VVVLIAGKINIKSNTVDPKQKGHYVMIKGLIQMEDIIIIIYANYMCTYSE